MVSVQHTFDPVPRLDARPPIGHGAHWDTYGGGSHLVSRGDSHNVGNYATTVAGIDAKEGNAVSNRFSDFLGPYEEHSSVQYQWSES